jgi:hypothetical protein
LSAWALELVAASDFKGCCNGQAASSSLPSLPERRIDHALCSAIMELNMHGVCTFSVDERVTAPTEASSIIAHR